MSAFERVAKGRVRYFARRDVDDVVVWVDPFL